MNMPAPKLLSSLPDGSNSRTGARSEPPHELTPHLSATQMWPPGATNTALVDPMVLPSGSVNQRSTVRYGFGCELAWAYAQLSAAINATSATMTDFHMTAPPERLIILQRGAIAGAIAGLTPLTITHTIRPSFRELCPTPIEENSPSWP